MVADRAGRQEEPFSDLLVGQARRGELGDLALLRGEAGAVRRAGPFAVDAGGAQLVRRPRGPWLGAELLKGVDGGPEVDAGVGR